MWLFFKVRYFSQGQSKNLPTPLFACDCRQTILFAENILDTSYSFLNCTRIFFRKYELPSDPWTVCSNDTAFWHHVQLSDAFFSAWTLGSDMMLGQRTLPHASDTRGHSLFVFGGRTVQISCRSLLTTLHISMCWLVIGFYIELPRFSFVNHTRIRSRGAFILDRLFHWSKVTWVVPIHKKGNKTV